MSLIARKILNEETPKEFFKRRSKVSADFFSGALHYCDGQFTWSDGSPGEPYLEAVRPSRHYNFRCEPGFVIIPKRCWNEKELAWIKKYPTQDGVRRIPFEDFDRHDRQTISSVIWPKEKGPEVLAKARSLGAKW